MIPALAAFMAGGFEPTQIANLELWLDASDTATITESSGDVSQWDDKSSTNNDQVQATAVRQPSTSTINGNPSMLFDGDGTPANADLLRDSAAAITSPPATIAVVFTPTSVAAGVAAMCKWRDSFTSVFQITRDGSAIECLQGTGGGANELRVAAVLAANETRWLIVRWRNSGDGDSDLLTDEGNTDTVTAAASINSSIDDINVGANADGNQAFAGHIHEILYYNRFISDSERADLEGYLNGKWTLS